PGLPTDGHRRTLLLVVHTHTVVEAVHHLTRPEPVAHVVELVCDDHARLRPLGWPTELVEPVLPADRRRQAQWNAEARNGPRLPLVGRDHRSRRRLPRAAVCRGDLLHVAGPSDLVADEGADDGHR